MSRVLFAALALLAIAPAGTALAQDAQTPAAATTPVMPKVGQLLRDAKGRRLAPIESIKGDAVYVILDMHMYRIPTSTLTIGDKGLQTSLLRSDLH